MNQTQRMDAEHSLSVSLVVTDGCSVSLGMQTGQIPDSAITASSSSSPSFGPANARYTSQPLRPPQAAPIVTQAHTTAIIIIIIIIIIINESATCFLHDLGRRISLVSGEDREPQFLFQRISVAIQRFNAVLLHDGFLSSDHPD